MKRKLLFLITVNFILLSLPCRAEEITLTLDEAVAVALRDNREVLLKSEDVKKAKASIKEARSAHLPSLSFTGNWAETRGFYPKDSGQTSTQATLKQYIYKGGKTVNTIKQAEHKLKVYQALLDKARLETVLNVKTAFYTLLLTEEFSRLNKGILDNTNKHLEALEVRYKNGQASEADLLEIKESLGSVQQAYEASLNQVESSQSLLRNLLYLSDDIRITPEGAFSYETKEIAYDEAFLKAIKTRPEIGQYEAQEKADKAAIETVKADNRPSIYASWDYYSRSTTSLTFSPSKGWQDYNIVGFTFSWPIFDGLATQAKVEQAIINLKETQLLKEKSIQDISLELRNAYLELKNAIAKIKSAQGQVEFYKNNFLTFKDKYKAGIASFLDLDDVALSYDISLFNQKEAIYDYTLAKAKFDKATGGI